VYLRAGKTALAGKCRRGRTFNYLTGESVMIFYFSATGNSLCFARRHRYRAGAIQHGGGTVGKGGYVNPNVRF
jgi:hypothetical protein